MSSFEDELLEQCDEVGDTLLLYVIDAVIDGNKKLVALLEVRNPLPLTVIEQLRTTNRHLNNYRNRYM